MFLVLISAFNTQSSSPNFAEVVNILLKKKNLEYSSAQGKETYLVITHKSITFYFVSENWREEYMYNTTTCLQRE